MNEIDFVELLETLGAVKGKFLLSSYPSDVLNGYVLKYGWSQKTFEQAVSVNSKSVKAKTKIEVLTANYNI